MAGGLILENRDTEVIASFEIPVSEARSGFVLRRDVECVGGEIVLKAGRVISEVDIVAMKRSGVEIISVEEMVGFSGSLPVSDVSTGRVKSGCGGILIVDDVPMIRKIIRRVLENAGYNITGEAEDGDDAVLMARKLRPELVTMDILMDRLDGINALRAIKHELPDTKVIVITSNIKPSVLLQCIKAGAENFEIGRASCRERVFSSV